MSRGAASVQVVREWKWLLLGDNVFDWRGRRNIFHGVIERMWHIKWNSLMIEDLYWGKKKKSRWERLLWKIKWLIRKSQGCLCSLEYLSGVSMANAPWNVQSELKLIVKCTFHIYAVRGHNCSTSKQPKLFNTLRVKIKICCIKHFSVLSVTCKKLHGFKNLT